MMGWSRAGLQRKLVMVLIGVLALASVLFLAVLASHYRSQMIGAHARAATQITDLLQGALENAMLKRDIPGLQDILTGLGTQQGVARAMIIAPSREVRFASDPALIGQVLDGDEVRQAVASHEDTTRYLTGPDGGTVLRSVNPVHNRAECSACHPPMTQQPVNGLLVVDFDAAAVRAEAIKSTLTLAGIGALVTALGSSALWLALRRVVIAPLARLSEASEAIAAGHHDTRVIPDGRDEIADLGRAFNSMSEGLTQSLAAVERSKQGLQSLIDGIPDGVRVIGDDYLIRNANSAYAAQVGQPLSAIVGQPCYRSSHGRDTPCLATLVTCPVAELRAGQRGPLTFRDTHRAGEAQIAVEVSSAPIAVEGGEGVVEAIRDLDRQMRLSQAERLAEIGLLAAGVAHEIHNPLSSVELAMQALSREVDAGRPERARDYFGLMRDEIGKCLEITDNLLRLSAPPGEGQALIDLATVVEGVTGLLRFDAERRGVTTHLQVPTDLRLLIPDADLRMLLTNLVMNSFHAMQPGGRVTIAARRLPATGRIEVRVADTGVGIAPADVERIFLPFWSRRADSSSGRGLGLAIVRSILDRNRGDVKVDSRQGEGTTFTLTFPDPDAVRGEGQDVT